MLRGNLLLYLLANFYSTSPSEAFRLNRTLIEQGVDVEIMNQIRAKLTNPRGV